MVLERGRALLDNFGMPSRVGAEIGARRLEEMARMSLQEGCRRPRSFVQETGPKVVDSGACPLKRELREGLGQCPHLSG